MTRIFSEDGISVPVSVVEVAPNRITQVKTQDSDGYCAVQVTTGTKKSSKVKKSEAGNFAKINMQAGRGLWEFRLGPDEGQDLAPGASLEIDIFEEGQTVDVRGTSIGKGFAGGVKRHNFRMQDATHGNSISHRAPGSIGQCQTPGRVFKGKRMAGHMGDEKVTTQNLKIVGIDKTRNLLLIKGSIPGAKGGDVVVTPAIKARKG